MAMGRNVLAIYPPLLLVLVSERWLASERIKVNHTLATVPRLRAANHSTMGLRSAFPVGAGALLGSCSP